MLENEEFTRKPIFSIVIPMLVSPKWQTVSFIESQHKGSLGELRGRVLLLLSSFSICPTAAISLPQQDAY